MLISRVIEFCFAVLVAFLILVVISFVSMRPILHEARIEAKAEWDAFGRAVKERNALLPGLLEAMKGFESGHGKLASSTLEARAISMRSSDPDRIVASVDDIDRNLGQIERVIQSKPELASYPPFAKQWKPVLRITRRIAAAKEGYNKSAQVYNRLLTPFPQNMLTALFGFVPLNAYPPARTPGEEE